MKQSRYEQETIVSYNAGEQTATIYTSCLLYTSLGRKLKEKFPDVKLVYITSYEEYCMQVINEVHAFSFLCKPLEYDLSLIHI